MQTHATISSQLSILDNMHVGVNVTHRLTVHTNCTCKFGNFNYKWVAKIGSPVIFVDVIALNNTLDMVELLTMITMIVNGEISNFIKINCVMLFVAYFTLKVHLENFIYQTYHDGFLEKLQ